jgi:hypothetical protein
VIKSKRIRWTKHVPFTGEKRNAYRVLAETLKKRHQLEEPGVDGRVTVKRILRKCNVILNYCRGVRDYNFQIEENKIKLLMEYESATQKVLFGNAFFVLIRIVGVGVKTGSTRHVGH